jgi:hypothetical protein
VARLRVLITVKTYPHPSTKYEETVCTAGIRADGGFARLYPIRFRALPYEQQYAKYQWIELEAERNPQDPRPESFRPRLDSVRPVGGPLGTDHGWSARKRIVLPHLVPSMEEVRERQQRDRTSLALIRPAEVLDLTVERRREPDWTRAELELLQQSNLFGPSLRPLPKVPYYFRYRFRCDDPGCGEHALMIEDWELGALYFNMLRQYGEERVAVQKVKGKFFGELYSDRCDTCFFVGNTKEHESGWLVLGIFYPPRELQLSLDIA